MSRSVWIRIAGAVCLCLVCTVFIAQTVGGNDPGDSKGVSAPPVAASADPRDAGDAQTGPPWAVLGLLIPGGILVLLRPRRRVKDTAPGR